ncbi:hypothetical protein QBC47DRAFT_408016 [Echria macrotheca]|uniref:Uncharacterized protein n=1 Tax=Echria macrotheca TaxID=438768 RepID=A0AAJ0F5S1_9PEZI|nr:hypothetical protein QBC47DRAFT_408016 [Echria macrotheca]
MLRFYYLCSAVSVALINYVPIPVDNMAKRVRCASVFSEWRGNVIRIHNAYGFRTSMVAMGSLRPDSVRSTFSPYRGTSTMVSYVTKEISYNWKIYPERALGSYMTEEALGPLTRALMNYTAGDLIIPFTNIGIPDTSDTGSFIHDDGQQSNSPMPKSVLAQGGPVKICETLDRIMEDWSLNDDELTDVLTTIKEKFSVELKSLERPRRRWRPLMPAVIEGGLGSSSR